MKKKVMIVVGILLAIILLIPGRYRYKDGGSIEYRAILYSVTDWHSMAVPKESRLQYVEGITVKILGIEVFDNAHWEDY